MKPANLKTFFKVKAKQTNEWAPFYNACYHALYCEGDENTLIDLVNSGGLVIGVNEAVLNNADKIHDDFETLVKNGRIDVFANVSSSGAQRGPVACGPLGVYYKENLKILEDEAPTLYEFVKHMQNEYKKKGKRLTGLWWTYYRADIDKTEVLWVPLGVMKPHCDRLGGASDRVIATFGSNTKGKQKRMSFHFGGKKKKSTVLINVYHGMYVCLSRKASGFRKFNDDYVYHGVDNAEGTWTITMEFTPDN